MLNKVFCSFLGLFSQALLLIACVAQANTDTLQLYYEQFPPYNYEDKGAMQGINAEIVQVICMKAEIQCQFTLLPWTRAFSLAQSEKNAGVFSTGMSSERRSKFLWVGPLVSGSTRIFKLKSRTDIRYSEVEGLRQYSVAVVRNTVTKFIMMQQGVADADNFVEFSFLEDYLPLFFEGKVDLIPGSDLALSYQLRRLNLPLEAVEPVFTLNEDGLGNYLALNKATSPVIADKLNEALVELKEQGWVGQKVKQYQNAP